MGRRRGRGAVILVAIAACVPACGTSSATKPPASSVGSVSSTTPDRAGATPVAVELAARQAPTADPKVAGDAVTAFGNDLFAVARSQPEAAHANLTVSPMSVAAALAMLEPGTVGDAQVQMRRVLHIDDPAVFHPSMNALAQGLEARTPGQFGSDGKPGEVTMRIANAAYLQQGYPFLPAYLDTVGANYGPVMNEVDFRVGPDAVAHRINAFVAKVTNDKIPELVGDGVLQPDDVLALVNALYLKASWLQPFAAAPTAPRPFTTLAGTAVSVPMMSGGSDSSASGDGWVGATKSYAGGLGAQFILPDVGRFDDIASHLDTVFAAYDAHATVGALLQVPKFTTRTHLGLNASLQALGLTAPYQAGGLLGVANDPTLRIDEVIHETYLAMDEQGTEAAAATVVIGRPVSAPALPPVTVVLDRPFLYRIIDTTTGATLFVGQVLDPTS